MLQTLHSKASGLFVKVLIGLLVASFAVWGIGDIFRSSSSSAVVSVGKSTVSAQELKNALDQEFQNYRAQLGEQYSTELMRNIGVPAQVLQKLVQQHLVEEEVRTQGLVTPDSYLMAELRNNPAFQGADGKFDAGQFERILMSNNLSESRYLALLAKEVAADMLLQSVFSGIQSTEAAARLAYLYENEKRIADFLVFPLELAKNATEPTEAQLEEYYKDNAANFVAKEHRVISMVAIDINALQNDMLISDEDVLIEYQNRIDEFREPEKREVKQLLYDDEAMAKKAAEMLNNSSIEDVAKKLTPNNNSLQLGNVTASGVIAEAEKAVFALKAGEHTKPVQSSFGWHVFLVSDITPERTRPLTEVKTQLKQDIRNARVGDEAYELSNTLQDDLAGGASIEEAAKSVGAQKQTFGPISAEGTAPDGTKVVLPEGYPGLLPEAYTLSEGEISNLMESENGSYYAIRVDSVMPERTRALDEIKGTVIAEWKEQQKGENLYQVASDTSSTLGNEDIATVANNSGATLLKNQTLTRNTVQFGDDMPLPSMMLTAIFSAQEGTATEAFALPDGSYVVAKLRNVEKADVNSQQGRAGIERSRENLRAVYADELYLQYMSYLRKKHGVSAPNEKLIEAVIQ